MNFEAVKANFEMSKLCNSLAYDLKAEVKINMTRLARTGVAGNLAARLISPLVGTGTFVLLAALRVGSVVEPIFGIISDIIEAIAKRDANCLGRAFIVRPIDFGRNLLFSCLWIPGELFTVGLFSGLGGILAPEKAYYHLTPFMVKAGPFFQKKATELP